MLDLTCDVFKIVQTYSGNGLIRDLFHVRCLLVDLFGYFETQNNLVVEMLHKNRQMSNVRRLSPFILPVYIAP